MANAAYYWDGKQWQPLSGGGGASGPQGPVGPVGPAGDSVSVFVQLTEPQPNREGDFWIEEPPIVKTPEKNTKVIRLEKKKYPTLDSLKKYPTLSDIERKKNHG
jgi:hypothetical protein